MKPYIALLRAEPLLRRLSLIQLIAYFGAWFSNVAIYTLLLQLGAAPFVIAMVAALHFIPGVLHAPFSGAIIDKVSPKRLMTILIVLEIATTLPMMLVERLETLWVLYVLVFVRMGASSFYFTLEMALLPRFLSSTSLKLANEIHSVIWSVAFTVGMAVSGVAVYAIGVKAAFFTDAMLFVLALILLYGAAFPVSQTREAGRYFILIRQSLSYLRKNPLIMHLMLLHAFVGFTAFDTVVALMTEAYYFPVVAAPLAIGMLHAFRAIGLVAGPLLFSRWINARRLPWLLLLQAGTIMAWALVLPNFYLSLGVSVLVGLATTTLWSFTYTLIQHHTDKAFYGRVIAYNDMIFLLTVSLVSLATGALAQLKIDLRLIMTLPGIAFIFAAFYFNWIRRQYKLSAF